MGASAGLARPAQYLLRFNDLCPTLARARWERFLPLIHAYNLRPILAVIPDNQDRDLQISPPNPGFWEEMRAMQAVGATIALQGYRHLCESRGVSMLPLHSRTEFAGVARELQLEWIHEGVGILRAQGLDPRMWVAPRHGLDHNTLRALHKEKIYLVSDGLARLPFTRGGLTWIPQQLWSPVAKSKGIWTISIHSNFCSQTQAEELAAFLRHHATQFTSVDSVLEQVTPTHLSLTERMYESWALWRAKARHARIRRRLEAKRHARPKVASDA